MSNLGGTWTYIGAGKSMQKMTSPDSAKYTFHKNGKLRYRDDYGTDESGKYILKGRTIKTILELSPGKYEIVSIGKKKMFWKSSIYYHFFQKK